MSSNYLSIHKLQQCSCWSLWIDTLSHPILYWICDFLSMCYIHVLLKGAPDLELWDDSKSLDLALTVGLWDVFILWIHWRSLTMLWPDLLHLYIMKDAIDNFNGILFVIDTSNRNSLIKHIQQIFTLTLGIPDISAWSAFLGCRVLLKGLEDVTSRCPWHSCYVCI